MSGTIQATAKVVIVASIVGIAGLVAFGNTNQPADATPAPAQVAPIAPIAVSVDEVATPPEPTHVLSVSVETSGSIRSALHGFATIAVEASTDVAQAKLMVDCASACEIVKVPQQKWANSGAGVRVDLGEMAAGDVRSVLVVFELEDDSARFETHTSYRDLHHTERPTVTSEPESINISRVMSKPSVYLDARRALSAEAVNEARELIDAGDFDEALDVVERAYTTNVQVGMALRFGGKLRDAQDEFDNLRAEIAELTKPKPRRRAPKPHTIDILRGDG